MATSKTSKSKTASSRSAARPASARARTAAATGGQGQNCAVINPYALAELVAGQPIPWNELPDPHRVLEQVLATHPEVATLEEREVLAEPAQAFLSSPGGMDKLAALGPEELSRLRGDYWRRVRQQGVEPQGKAFIDKLPLNTIKLPVIAKLFPRAKVLFAVRDPRDVVLSCFRQHFQVNAAMFEFLTLEAADGRPGNFDVDLVSNLQLDRLFAELAFDDQFPAVIGVGRFEEHRHR